jgi:hypothetical protein
MRHNLIGPICCPACSSKRSPVIFDMCLRKVGEIWQDKVQNFLGNTLAWDPHCLMFMASLRLFDIEGAIFTIQATQF